MDTTKNDETAGLLERNGIHILRNPEKIALIKSIEMNKMPLEIEWLFGWNTELGVAYVAPRDVATSTDRPHLRAFFVCAHVGVVLECDAVNKTKEMKTLTGHRNCIGGFDVAQDGRLLVTADRGERSTIIVWDSVTRSPVLIASSPSKTGIAIVKFSADSEYLVTVSAVDGGQQTICLWDLASGFEEPICSTELDNSFGPIVHVARCRDNSNFYCFTTKNCIFFMTSQLLENVNELIITVPKRSTKHLKHDYTQSAYVTNFRQVVSATTAGLVTVWDDVDYKAPKIKNTLITNDKQFLKNVQLDDHSITSIICQNDYIITGNINGDVFFYDKSLCVLYHLTELVGEYITSISMQDIKTIDKEISSDILGTRDCKIFYVDISINSCTQISEKFGIEPITALDVHPTEYNVILGNKVGELNEYDYQLKKLIASYIDSQGETVAAKSQVTSIKYSPNGIHLCYGCADGTFRFLNSRRLMPRDNASFKWNESPVQHITFSNSSKYVVYTDNLFGIYLYGVTMMSKTCSVKYYGCYEVHTGIIRGISMVELKTNLLIYSVGADHKIAIFKLDKTCSRDGELPRLVKILNTEPQNKPRCMMKSTKTKGGTNLIISGSDFRLTLWDDNRCIKTTLGVNLESPIKIMKESPVDNSIAFFCNDTDIGMLRQPIDGNPFKNIAVQGSGTKIIDFGISKDIKFLFSISEDSSSVLMWSIHTSYLDELEKHGGTGLKAYSFLLEGGENGSEIALLKEYFYSVQLANSQYPERIVLSDFVNVSELSFLMRAMGYYPSETELSNMLYEVNARNVNNIGRHTTLVTFEEFVILYLNYKPQCKIKFNEIRQAFNKMVLNATGKNKILTKETFVHMIQHFGEKISYQEMEIILRTLLKTTNDISSDTSENIYSNHEALPLAFTFEEVMTDLFGFQATKINEK